MNSFSYFSRSGKLKKIFFCTFLCVLGLLFFSSFIQTKMYNSRALHDKQMYGNFDGIILTDHFNLKKDLEENQMISKIGQVVLYEPYEVNEIKIRTGSYDPTAEELASFQIIKGRFPETEEEGMIEISMLDKLGMSYDLNQIISFQNEEKVQDIKIVGIIQNYTNSWIAGDRFPSLILGQKADPYERIWLVKMKDGFPNAINDLTISSSDTLIRNRSAELSFDLFGEDNRIYTVLNVLFVIATAGILIYFCQSWIKSHTNEIISLKAMGATNARMNRDIRTLVFYTAGISFLLFLTASFLCGIEWILIGWDSLFFLAICIFCTLFLSYSVRKVPCIFSMFESENQEHKTYPSFKKRITPLRMVLRYTNVYKKGLFGQIIVLGVVGALLIGSMTQYLQNTQYASWTELEPDFMIRSDLVNEEDQTTFDEEDLEKIRNFPNVSVVEFLWQTNPEYSLRWKDNRKSVLRKMEKDDDGKLPFNLYNSVSEETQNITIHNISAYSVDHWDQKEELFSDVEGNVNWEEYKKGNEIILYLPEMIEIREEENLFPQYDVKGSNESEQQTVLKEESIHIGDVIEIKDRSGNTRNVKIGGILRSSNNSVSAAYGSFLYFPYSVLASDAFFGKKCCVNEVTVWLDSYQNLNWVESQMNGLTISRHMNMENKSHENERQYSFFKKETGVYLIVSIFLLFVFIGSSLYFSLKDQEQKHNFARELETALIRPCSIKKIFTLQSLLFLVLFAGSVFIFSIILYFVLTSFIANLNELSQLPYNLFDLNTGAPIIAARSIHEKFIFCLLIFLPIEMMICCIIRKITI